MDTILAALINGFVVSAPLAAVVWLVLGVSRRWVNAATRYAVWSILLAVVVCLPFRYVPFRSSPQFAPRIATTRAALPATAIVPPPSVPPRSSRPMRADAPRFPVRVAPGSWSVWVMAAWAIAAFGMLLRLFVSYALLGKMKRQAADAPEAVAASARSALERLGVTRRVRIAVVNDAVSPMVAGPFRPTILLPAVMLESMDEAEISQICLHEAAHLARRDDWALMAQRLIEVVFALHPLVRWIAAQINLEREIACDDLVISVTGSARPYASCLTRIAELAGAFSGSSAAAAVSDERSHLTRRVEMLLDKTRHAGARLLGARLAVLACGLALVTLLAARTPGVLVLLTPQRTMVAPSAALIAQARPPATTPAPVPAAVPAPAKQPAAQVIRVAVSVTDPMSRFVTGLEASAFHVFENGVEQKIVDFTPQEQPVSVAIVWDEKSELRDLRSRLARLRETYTASHPDVIVAEARIAEIENRVPPSVDVAGSQVSLSEVGENQSLADGLQSARDQLRATPAEQAAMVLVLGAASWPAGRLAVVNAYGFPVYALGIADQPVGPVIGPRPYNGRNKTFFFGGSFSPGAVPVLVSGANGVVQYPIVTPAQASASLAALITQLANQYIVGYVPSASTGPGESRSVDIRMTPPAGLPALTARVSAGYYAPRDRR